jgi:hypothetical protein
MAGIADPLRDLPDLYALIDVTEHMLLESMEADKDREQYWLKMYRPQPGLAKASGGGVPRGWSAEDEMAAFESATSD